MTLTLDEAVWRIFRSECIRRGVSASTMVEEFMQFEFYQMSSENGQSFEMLGGCLDQPLHPSL